MKEFVKRIALAVITLTVGLGTPAVMAGAASAAVTPVIYNSPIGGWSHAQVKPQWVVINQSGSPEAHTWYWNTWNSATAKSTGTLWVNTCKPYCAAGHYSYHRLHVTMSGVKYHSGHAYYSVMTWYTPGYRIYGSSSSTLVLHFGIRPGASIPAWR